MNAFEGGWDDFAAPYAAVFDEDVREYTKAGLAARRRFRIGVLETIWENVEFDPTDAVTSRLESIDAHIAARRSAWLAHARRPRPFEVVMMIEQSVAGAAPESTVMLLTKPIFWLVSFVLDKAGVSPEARITRFLTAGRCPVCKYLVADPVSPVDSRRKRLAMQRVCTECGHPWPLVPPPTSALPG